MRYTKYLATSLLFASSLISSLAEADNATRVTDAIWAADRIFSTVLTPTSFVSPPAQSVDILYNFSMSGLTGQRSVSEAYPGSEGFNGGRWSVKIAVFTKEGKDVHDLDGDGQIDSEFTNAEAVLEHVELGHIDLFDTTIYFECPMLP